MRSGLMHSTYFCGEPAPWIFTTAFLQLDAFSPWVPLYGDIPETHQRKTEGKRYFSPVWTGPKTTFSEFNFMSLSGSWVRHLSEERRQGDSRPPHHYKTRFGPVQQLDSCPQQMFRQLPVQYRCLNYSTWMFLTVWTFHSLVHFRNIQLPLCRVVPHMLHAYVLNWAFIYLLKSHFLGNLNLFVSSTLSIST